MLIVKIGGGDQLDLDGIARDLASLQRQVVVIHGANRVRDRIAAALGHPPTVVESMSGQTSVLSDVHAIDALMAAYAGIRNKRLVEALRRAGLDAIGLTGLDGGLVRGRRNPGIRVKRDGKKLLLHDFSGRARQLNTGLLEALLARGMTPVLTVPIAGEDGTALNSENDDILTVMAMTLHPGDVVSLIEAPGLLADKDDPASLASEVAPAELAAWEDRVDGRMRRKVRALRRLFEEGESPSPRVRLADGRIPSPVSAALAGGGTLMAHSPTREQPPGETGSSPGEPALAAGAAETGHPRDLDVYGRRGLTLVRGEGAVVWDENGRPFIDCIGGHGALALGHRHPALTAALQAQAARLWYTPGSFQNPARTAFLEALHQRIPRELARTFLSNSGTEAVEAGLKFARLHTGRSGLVAAEGGFHGRTMGSLSVTAERRYRDPFEPLVPGVRRVRFNDPEALTEAIDDSTAAVILEPVQGEGGVHPASTEFLQAARQACDDSGALLILDEVQTGFGRTGALFAFQRSGIVPDILCLAKSVAGGLPLGATVLRRGIEVPSGAHGSTFGGNPIACAVGRAVLQVLSEPGFLDSVEEKGARLADRIRRSESLQVKDVRQVGLMVGIQVRTRARVFVQALQERGVLALTAGSRVIRLLPPLVISDSQLSEVEEILLDVLAHAT